MRPVWAFIYVLAGVGCAVLIVGVALNVLLKG